MLSYISLGLIGVLLFWTFRKVSALRRNIALAKASGLSYHISPLQGMPTWDYIMIEPLVVGLLSSIPFVKDSKWPLLYTVHRGWTWRQRMHEQLGEAYLVVSPTMIYLNCNDPEGILQISTRRHDFVKPQELYSIVDIFGESILSSEGETWKRHRNIVAPAFAEKSNLLVWEESLRQAKGLLKGWSTLPGNTKDLMMVHDASINCSHLALHVISGAGFGVSQLFQGEDDQQLSESIIPGFNTEKLSEGHIYTFKYALQELVQSVVWMLLLPRWILERSPFNVHKKLLRAHHECTNYFNELANYKSDLLDRGNAVDSRTMDLMAPMVKASQRSPEESKGVYLTKQEVTADSWILLFAGHETTANTLHYTMVFLAIALDTQRELQEEIDSIIGNRPQENWTYEKDMGALYNSLVGACFSEALRLMPPVPEVPKANRPNAQPLTLNGKTYMLPANTLIHLDGAAVHRNRKYWPHSPSKITSSKHDMNDFVPQRWLSSNQNHKTSNQSTPVDTENIDGLEKASFETTTSGLYVPAKGTYLPFAEGPRSCPGRRFAQVEMTAVLTSVFKNYSFELDVSKYASDAEVESMGKSERRAIYEKAKAATRKQIDGSITTIAMRMMSTCPLRIVKRGNERFMDCYQ